MSKRISDHSLRGFRPHLMASVSRCAFQAELPFKSKPKVQAPRKRQSLEQKRAVVLEPEERKAVTLYSQLNAIRNQKAVKRRDQQTRRRGVCAPRGFRAAGVEKAEVPCILVHSMLSS